MTCHALRRFSQIPVQLWMPTFELITGLIRNSQDETLLCVYSALSADSKEAASMAPFERFSDSVNNLLHLYR